MNPSRELPELIVPDGDGWRVWLSEHHENSSGVRLVLARAGAIAPTSLTYDDALEEALCVGWIDGQLLKRDDATYYRRFTPRRPRSVWSRRNVQIVQRLIAEGRMRPAGVEQVQRAKEQGRWENAYESQAASDVPADLARALVNNPRASTFFASLSAQNRYSILYRVGAAKKPETRAQRIATFITMLEKGETIHPQGGSRS